MKHKPLEFTYVDYLAQKPVTIVICAKCVTKKEFIDDAASCKKMLKRLVSAT